MSASVSRRTVAKGAAWAAPAVVLAPHAPALAASPQPPRLATAEDIWVWSAFGQPAPVAHIYLTGRCVWPDDAVVTIRRATDGVVVHVWRPTPGTEESHVSPALGTVEGQRSTSYHVEATLQGVTTVVGTVVAEGPPPTIGCQHLKPHRVIRIDDTGFSRVEVEVEFPDDQSVWPDDSTIVAYDEEGRVHRTGYGTSRNAYMAVWLGPPEGRQDYTYTVRVRLGKVVCSEFPVRVERTA